MSFRENLHPRDRHGRWVRSGVGSISRTAASTGRKAKSTGKSKGTSNRPSGLKGLKAATVPYVRVNKRSQTVGVNAGTVIPGTRKRIVGGAYLRVESTTRHTSADKIAGKAANRVLPKGTRRGKAARAFKRNFSVNNPAIRATSKNVQARVGTSRGAGPTLVVRRGKHKAPQAKSYSGIKSYDTRMRALQGVKQASKTARPQRRKAARKRR